MARKPLIQPGSVLPVGGLQAEIIKSDREKAGRPEPEENTVVKQVGVNEGVLTGVSETASTESSNREGEQWRESVIERARELGSKRKLPQTRFNADIDEELHKQLRLHCIDKGLSLKQFLPALLEEYLKGVKR
jgi:predicted HicB family RNase H-like nuclease